MSIYRLILYIGFLMIYGLCKAENPLYTVIGKAQGLPSHEIYDIYQDKKGFMWFATEEGLCRYDGFSTKRFVAPRQGYLSGTYIQEDRYGRIWYITFEGFAYYTSGDSLYKLQEPISSNPLWYSFAIIEDNILLLRENGVHIYDITTLQIKKEVFLNTKNLLTPFRSDSHFMISTTDTIYQINKNGAIRKQPFAALTLSAYKDSTLYSFGRGNSLTYSILTPNLESRSGNIKGGGFLSNLEKCNDELWLCTTNGVYRGIPEVDSFSQKFFEGKSINCVFLDREGNYWFGIGNEGVFLVNDLHTSIFLPTIEGNTVTINDNNIVIGNTNGEIILLKPDMTIEKTVFKTGTKHKIRSILIGEKYNFILSDKLYATDTNWKAIGGNTLAIKSLIPIDHKYYAFAGTGRIGLFRLLNPNHEMIKSEWDNVFNLNYSDAYSHNGLLLSFFNQEYLRGTSVAYDSIHKIIYFNTSNGIKTFSPSDAGEFKYQNNRITAISLVFHGRSTCILLNTGELLQTHDGKTAQQLSFSHQNITIKPKSIKLIGDYLYLITETGLYRTPSRNLNAQNNPFSIGCSLVMNAPDYDNEILDFTVRQNKLYILALKGVVVKTLLESEPTYNPKFSIDKIINNSKYHSTDAELCFSYNENDIRVDYNILSFMTKGEFPLYYRINKGEWKQTEKNSRSLLLKC
ncbi:MAG: hypothetical protein K1X92_00880 [Bacteroidia bacterium]|nr:hypothetical protein [Bacteroidia bacterium]